MASRVAQFEALVAGAPGNELFRFSLAQTLIAEGRPTDAIPHFEFCVAKKSDWMMPRILLGKLFLAQGRREEARSLLQSALELAVSQSHEGPERELRALLQDLR